MTLHNKNLDEVGEEGKQLWEERISASGYLGVLVMSMPRRVAEVIERNGDITSYYS